MNCWPQFLAAWSPEKKVVVYCGSEGCNASREVARRLRKEAQLPNVFVLEGGWDEWLKRGNEETLKNLTLDPGTLPSAIGRQRPVVDRESSGELSI